MQNYYVVDGLYILSQARGGAWVWTNKHLCMCAVNVQIQGAPSSVSYALFVNEANYIRASYIIL